MVHVLFPINYSLLTWSPNGLGKCKTFASQVAKFVVFAVWYILIGVFLTFVCVFYRRMKDLFFFIIFSSTFLIYSLSHPLGNHKNKCQHFFYEFCSWLFIVPSNQTYAPTAHSSLFQLWVIMMVLSLPVIGPAILVQIKVKSLKVQIKQVKCEKTLQNVW